MGQFFGYLSLICKVMLDPRLCSVFFRMAPQYIRKKLDDNGVYGAHRSVGISLSNPLSSGSMLVAAGMTVDLHFIPFVLDDRNAISETAFS
jgi:hypothetical protein